MISGGWGSGCLRLCWLRLAQGSRRGWYEYMLKMLELPASACVFVDDSPRNLPPAAALGMATVQAQEPRATITSVQNLLNLNLLS
ncbi:HAD-IA family hydrolase [Streptomyces sp. NPDC006147]|uniref:HAD-IA family hydrolase n=1 Tax=Streptomyces sp. NPDC006147 TaxID=3155597 RepID=UPI00339F7529